MFINLYIFCFLVEEEVETTPKRPRLSDCFFSLALGYPISLVCKLSQKLKFLIAKCSPVGTLSGTSAE